MSSKNQFEQAFNNFIKSIYDNSSESLANEHLQLIYSRFFDELLNLLDKKGIRYDTFIEQELNDWALTDSTGNPLSLSFNASFLQIYANENHKYSLLVICLQSQLPKQDISTALINACYRILNGTPSGYHGVVNFLEALEEYPAVV